MPRGKSKDYYVKPFIEDVEELLGRFQQTDSVRFEDFSAIWRSMVFHSVFYGTLADSEMREFCQLTLTTAFNYFLPPYSFQIRVGALYLLYGLYNTQHALPKAKIRFALKDWDQIQKFYQDSLRSQHSDVVYVLKKLVTDSAFIYTAMPQLLSFRVKKDQQSKVCEAFRDRPQRVKEFLSTDVLEVANVQAHYERLKSSVLKSPIAVIHQDFPGRLYSCMMEFLRWQDRKGGHGEADPLVATEEETREVESSNRAQVLASIKSKSYGHLTEASKSRRHRQVKMEIPEVCRHQRKGPSLRARTQKNFGLDAEERKTQYWLLSTTEKERAALLKRNRKLEFRW
ncbi:hypothetical protein UPYG_G00253690 [Umbra pygmaea]|uniref:Small nuclear RNA activating complex polypeptide 1 n=1 Tax=Umbra pygmaea TaxID=75934 RepID=A0ABD0WV41_UMBPY